MIQTRHCRRCASIVFAMMAACAGQIGPAQQSISDIHGVITAAAAEAATYVPERLRDVQQRQAELQAAFDRRDYAAVLAGAPAVMSAAQSLAAAAAAKHDEILRVLNAQWADLAAAIPARLSGVQSRLDVLERKANRKAAAGIDVPAARDGLSALRSSWSKAQAAFATGNLGEAVTIAGALQDPLHDLEAGLQSTPVK